MASLIRIGVIGNAMIARDFMIPELSGSEICRVTAIASRTRLEKSVFPELKHYDSYEALLEDPGIDAVYVPVPNALHAKWSICAMEHGKHVLCEKPLACTAEDAHRMKQAAQENGVLLTEAFMYRYSEKFRKLLQIVQSGVLGRIRSMQGVTGYPLTWKSPAREDALLGGGCLYDVGCYVVDCMNTVMKLQGEHFLDADAVLGFIGGVDWNAAGWLRYDGGTLGVLHSWFQAQQEQYMTLVGDYGSLVIPMLFEPEGGELMLTVDGKTETIPVRPCPCYRLEAEDFSRRILSNQLSVEHIDDSIENLRVLEAIYANAHRFELKQ